MNASRILLQRMGPNMLKTTNIMGRRAAFTTECAPARRLRTVFEEYRRDNFPGEVSSRVRKEIIKEIEEPDHMTFQVDSLNRVLGNIGRQDALLTSDEMEALLREAGVPKNQRGIPIEKMTNLM